MTTLRRATAVDVPSIGQIAQAAYAPYVERMGGLRPGPMDLDYDDVVAQTETWVLEVEQTVVGFLVLTTEPESLLLSGVALHPAHQGHGHGRRLLAFAEERATALGRDRIRLFTHVTMTENQQLYERTGYVETHRAAENGFARVFYEKAVTC
jgi:ribosomal protein S18 acetylase RimI-like enzyme